jgi:hypothetical protein
MRALIAAAVAFVGLRPRHTAAAAPNRRASSQRVFADSRGREQQMDAASADADTVEGDPHMAMKQLTIGGPDVLLS